jgi:hypothetical protein
MEAHATAARGGTMTSHPCRRALAAICLLRLCVAAPVLADEADAFCDAARRGDFQAVHRLLGEDPELARAADRHGYTALRWAVNGEHGAVARLLLERGADADAVGADGGTPLHGICHHDDPELTRLLLDAGADPNLANRWGRTPVHVAARRDCRRVLALLLERGGDLTAVTREGWTPLHVASKAGHPAVAELLLAAGADPAAEDAEGRIPAAMAFVRPPVGTIGEQEARVYQGVYALEQGGSFRVWWEDGALRLEEFAADVMDPLGPDRFLCRREPWTVTFLRDEAGAPTTIRVDFLRRTVEARRVARPEYVGSDVCLECHFAGGEGDPGLTWLSGRHAAAYWRLATDWAAFLASQRPQYVDIASPVEASRCLLCHVTGWQWPGTLRGPGWKRTEGVGCESCHGPGSLYVAPGVMGDRAAFLAAGGVFPDAATCRRCHRRPREFDFADKWAKIAHGAPAGGG